MAKIPKNPGEIFSEITDDFKKVFADDLVSIILYGSGASGHYLPGKSDLNFLVVLSEEGIDKLDKAVDTVTRWRKRKVSIPLFMTSMEIVSSVDSYPIEFLTMKQQYILVHGKDILSGLSFAPSHLKLQFERELKGKILHLRRGFLETEGQVKRVRELIKNSFTAFISLFKALLHVKGIDIPEGRRDIIRAAAGAFPIDAAVFLKCADIKEGIDGIPASEVPDVFHAYIKEIEKLTKYIDEMNI